MQGRRHILYTGFLQQAFTFFVSWSRKEKRKETGYKSSLKFLFLNERRQRNKTSAETQAPLPLPSPTGKQARVWEKIEENRSPDPQEEETVY